MDRTRAEPDVVGIGYEGRDLTTFVADLVASGVRTVVDVRLTPLSRKRGFSKRALGEALRDAGIEYLQLRELGNPRPNREGFAGGDVELRAARARYADLLESPAARTAVDRVVALAGRQRVALLCFEAEDRRCHRQVLLDRVADRLDPEARAERSLA